MEEKYTEVEVEVTFRTTIEVPEDIAHDRDLIGDFAQEFGSTEESLSTGDVDIDISRWWYRDEDGHLQTHT